MHSLGGQLSQVAVFTLVNNGRTQHTQLCLADCTTVCTYHQVRKKGYV